MTQAMSTHLGEALGTDLFSVREQFTGEQWEHFITVRKFVDEEVVPVIGGYWERAEICWLLVRRLPAGDQLAGSRPEAARGRLRGAVGGAHRPEYPAAVDHQERRQQCHHGHQGDGHADR